MDNKNRPNENAEELLPPAKEHRRQQFPLVLPEEEIPQRTRPAVTAENVEKLDGSLRTRPALSPEEILKEEPREVFAGRITGARHSIVSSAAEVKTRAPEEKEEPAQVIPAVVSAKAEKPKKAPAAVKAEPKKKPEAAPVQNKAKAPKAAPKPVNKTEQKTEQKMKKSPILLVLLVLVGVAVLFGAASFAVSKFTRPVDPSVAETTDGSETNVPDTEAPETSAPETSAAETDAPETSAPETVPAETEAPALARYSVTVQAYNREPVTVTTGTTTVGELLHTIGFVMTETDRVALPVDTVIEADTVIVIDTVEIKTFEETETISFESIRNEVQTIPRGEVQTLQNGEDGEKTLTYSVEIVNGVEGAKTLLSETVTKEPIAEITEIGVGGELVGADGKTYTYSYYRVVSAAYYEIEGPTWYGHDASDSTVAADFDYLPLGTKLYVKNDSFDFGVRVVEDTGTMKGYDINIWLGKGDPRKAEFGAGKYVDDMIIYYLD